MAAIDDLIAQVEDPALRERLAREVAELQRSRKFGLVFEHHLPELLPIYSAKPRRGDLIAQRRGPLTDTWLVLKVERDRVHGVKRSAKQADTFAIGDIVVVRQFGEPIFPSLVKIDKVQNGPAEGPWHMLIEADNYHALQLLEYLYAGQTDCIYIDPPYNTGARDWKYNNDYVDANDTWRHSKWLAMMRRRLALSLRLLKPSGVMCVTIDDYELAHLTMLIEQFSLNVLGAAVIKNKPQGRPTARGFSVNHEYALFLGMTDRATIGRLPRRGSKANRYPFTDDFGVFAWSNFRKSGNESMRVDRPKQFYPLCVKGDEIRIPIMEWNGDSNEWCITEKLKSGEELAWPLDRRGRERVWTLGSDRARDDARDLRVARGSRGLQIYRKYRPNQTGGLPGTWWDDPLYSASESGTKLLESILGESNLFSFPKSVYAVADCLRACNVGSSPTSLVIDFFAGSGTTLDAVNLLNAADGGQRRCILVTNNEVSGNEAEKLIQDGHFPGDEAWEKQGVCRSVTWPRSKFTILGKRDDGTELPGEYITAQMKEEERSRQYTHIGFLESDSLVTTAKKRQLLALIEGLPQSLVAGECPFIVSEDYPVSVLFNEVHGEKWLEALDGQDHITRFVIVAGTKRRFDELKETVNEVLGPLLISEEVRRPLKVGFPANLEYFRLDFLDKDQVALKQRFHEILSLLWMRAGCVGPRPELPPRKPEPQFFVPKESNFAVLLDEMRFGEFKKALTGRTVLKFVFLVTDSHEAFEEMAAQLPVTNVIQLYRDYLENFMINKGGAA